MRRIFVPELVCSFADQCVIVILIPTDDPAVEKAELADIAKAIPKPDSIAKFDSLTPRVICQQFRANTPVGPQKQTCGMLSTGIVFDEPVNVLR